MTMEFTCYTLPNGIRCIHKQVRSAVVNCALTVCILLQTFIHCSNASSSYVLTFHDAIFST